MSEAKWSPEPWEWWTSCSFRRLTSATGRDGDVLHGDVQSDGQPDVVCSEANRRRIVACVNACAGIPTEALESGALANALDEACIASHELHEDVCGAECCAGCKRFVAALRALGRLK